MPLLLFFLAFVSSFLIFSCNSFAASPEYFSSSLIGSYIYEYSNSSTINCCPRELSEICDYYAPYFLDYGEPKQALLDVDGDKLYIYEPWNLGNDYSENENGILTVSGYDKNNHNLFSDYFEYTTDNTGSYWKYMGGDSSHTIDLDRAYAYNMRVQGTHGDVVYDYSPCYVSGINFCFVSSAITTRATFRNFLSIIISCIAVCSGIVLLYFGCRKLLGLIQRAVKIGRVRV